MLATWLPHYLGWPWWPDIDAWATIAQGWDEGIRPYRDVVIFNFPGQIYECYALGKLSGGAGPGRSTRLDAAMLLGLGAAGVAWSRRRFGWSWPGLLGWTAALAVYLDLDYAMVAQRRLAGPFLAAIALFCASGAGPVGAGRVGRAHGPRVRDPAACGPVLPGGGMSLAVDGREGASWAFESRRWIAWGVPVPWIHPRGLRPVDRSGAPGRLRPGGPPGELRERIRASPAAVRWRSGPCGSWA